MKTSEIWISDGIVSFPVIEVALSNPSKEHKERCKALLDTGAGISSISKSLIKELGIIETGFKAPCISSSGNTDLVDTYDVKLFFRDDFHINITKARELLIETEDFRMVIGMDIISLGNFFITNNGGKTVISFELVDILKNTTRDYSAR